jgi:hypothetical protein
VLKSTEWPSMTMESGLCPRAEAVRRDKRVGGQLQVDIPKTGAGMRDVAIPPHLIERFRDHLAVHAGGSCVGHRDCANADSWIANVMHQAPPIVSRGSGCNTRAFARYRIAGMMLCANAFGAGVAPSKSPDNAIFARSLDY